MKLWELLQVIDTDYIVFCDDVEQFRSTDKKVFISDIIETGSSEVLSVGIYGFNGMIKITIKDSSIMDNGGE